MTATKRFFLNVFFALLMFAGGAWQLSEGLEFTPIGRGIIMVLGGVYYSILTYEAWKDKRRTRRDERSTD